MHQIKFSHEYTKMPYTHIHMDKTILLEVLLGSTKTLHEQFVNYDTHIRGKSPLDINAYYKLPAGKLIILILKTTHRIENSLYESSGMWTTIRRWTPEKEAYYRSIRGQDVEIVVKA